MKTNPTFSEQLRTIGKQLEQNKTCEGHIYTGNYDEPGYFDALLTLDNFNLLNRTDIQILDIHQEESGQYDAVWGFAFKINTTKEAFWDTLNEIEYWLDDDSTFIQIEGIPEIHLGILKLCC